MITTIHRAYDYQLALEIDERTYKLTKTGDGVGYAFKFDDARADLARHVERTAADREATLEDLEIAPGYLLARLTPELSRGAAPPPKHLDGVLIEAATTWNKQNASRREELHVGDHFIEVVRPADALTPEAFIEGYCETPEDAPEAMPDPADGPVFTLEAGDIDTFDADADRHQPITAIIPVRPETYDPVENTDQYDDTEATFSWAENTRDQLQELIERTGRGWGRNYRLEVHPHYLRLDAYNPSLTHNPAAYVLRDLRPVIGGLNLRRPVVAEVTGGRTLQRPELQIGEDLYIGARSTEGRADEWLAARGCDEIDAEPYEPEPDPEPEPEDGNADAADESGGLLNRLRGS